MRESPLSAGPRRGLLLVLPLGLLGCDAEPQKEPDPNTNRCGDYSALKNPYFGDLHTHTSFSLDAYAVATRADPAAAYAFAAKLQPITVASGNQGAQGPLVGAVGPTTTIDRRLDFLAVTDHSEFFQVDHGCTVDSSSAYYGDTFCQNLRAQGTAAQAAAGASVGAQVTRVNPTQPALCRQSPAYTAACRAQESKAWSAVQQAAKAANNPCSFTSFVAFEWTNSLNGNNLHRNVIFKGEAVPPLALDYLTYPTAAELWAALDRQCQSGQGCEAMTIPHNSNASGGQMFVFAESDVPAMQKYQTLAEVHQHKGNSECITDTSDTGQVSACTLEVLPGRTTDGDRPGYVRPALESGLSYYASKKKNPLQLGFVGATDTHNSTPGHVAEEGWPGHLGGTDNSALLRVAKYTNNCNPNNPGCQESSNPLFNPGGITGVWAEQNTRESLWAALRRREVFATSGPRIKPRFYQFSGTSDPCADPSFPQQVVQGGGVPMGGTMARPASGAPRFVVSALKDRVDLAEVHLVKASVSGGQVKEQVVKLSLAGKTCVTWTDSAFSATDPAFYYARVVEQPSWRWSHYDCLALKQSNPADWQTIAPGCASGDPAKGGLDYMVQERAWTSPIWYLP